MFEGFQKSRNLLVSLHKAHKLIFSYLAIPFIWDPLYRDLFPTHLDLVLWNRKKMYLSECLFFNPCFSLTFHQMTRTYYSIQDIFFYSLFYGVSHFCDFQLDLRKQHIVKWEQLRLLSLAQIHSLSLSSRWLHLPVWLWTLKTIEMFSTATKWKLDNHLLTWTQANLCCVSKLKQWVFSNA